MTKESLQEQIAILDSKRDAIRQQIDPLNKQLMLVINQRKALLEKLDAFRDNPNATIPELLEFSDTLQAKKALENFLKSLGYEEFGALCLPGGYYPDTNQFALRVVLYRDDPVEKLEKLAKDIELFLPHIKPLGNNMKVIDIFEHTLSYSCSYSLQITSDDKRFFVCAGHYRRQQFASLLDALQYIRKNHYYEKSRNVG